MDDSEIDPHENYYLADQASEVLESQPTTTTASVDGTDDGAGISAYGRAPPVQARQQLPLNPAGSMGTQGYIDGASLYSIDSAGQLSQASFPASHAGWHAQDQSSMFATDGSTGLTANPSFLNPFEYQHYQDVHHTTTAEMSPMLFSGNYAIPPTTTGTSLGFSYSLDAGSHASGLGSDTAGVSSGAGSVSTAPSSLGTTPLSFASGSSSGPYTTMPGIAIGALPERGVGSRGSGSQPGSGRDKPEEIPQAKRTKRARRSTATRQPVPQRTSVSSEAQSPLSPSMPAPAQASSSRAPPGGKQRRVSSSSKASTQAPLEAADDPMRSTHNVVEKQYRNRLNAQFEGLMSALPENLRNETTAGQPLGDMGIADATDRRPSKAEVLEMARQHIQSLEKERDTLERERNKLLGNMEELKDEYAKGAAAQGKAADGWRQLLKQEAPTGKQQKGKGVDQGAAADEDEGTDQDFDYGRDDGDGQEDDG